MVRNRRQRQYKQPWRRLSGHRVLLRVPSGEQWLTHRTQSRPCTRCGFPRPSVGQGYGNVLWICFVWDRALVCGLGWPGPYRNQLASLNQLLGRKVELLNLGLSVAGSGEDGRCRAVPEVC